MQNRKFNTNEHHQKFYHTLRIKVFDVLKNKNIKTGDFNFWLKGILWISVSYTSYLCLLNTSNKASFWLLFLIFQLSGLLIGFSLGHDASHQTAFKNKKHNQILHFFSFLTIGIDPLLWGLRHIRSHHLYANIEGSDIDIDKNPFLRLAPSHSWKRKHQFQHIYAPFVYMLALLHSVFFGDWIYLFQKEYEWMRRGINKNHLFLRFFIFKVCYFSLILLIPLYFTSFSLVFIFITYVTTSAFTSLLFVVMLVGTHFFYEAEYHETGEDELMSTWAVHQLKTSCDWHPNSSWARYLSGGSNCHAAHHLFPNICHTNYSKINKIIENTTNEYELPYHKKTLVNMIKSHFKHLKRMGSKI